MYQTRNVISPMNLACENGRHWIVVSWFETARRFRFLPNCGLGQDYKTLMLLSASWVNTNTESLLLSFRPYMHCIIDNVAMA